MKVENIKTNNYVTKKIDKPSNMSGQSSNIQLTRLSEFPKSYIKISPSFGASLKEDLDMKNERTRNRLKDDFIWSKTWDPSKAKKEYDLQAKNEIAIERKKSTWGLSNEEKDKIIEKYNKKYKNDEKRYNYVKSHEEELKKLLGEDISKKHLSVSELLKSYKGSLDSKIAGYSDLKRTMGWQFLKPVKDELFDGQEREVANCILLCGPTGCGKTVAAEAMANETACYVDKVPTDTDPKFFAEIVRDKIIEARARYFEREEEIENFKNSVEYSEMTDEQKEEALLKIGSPRTVILIDEFDKYFNPIIVDKGIRLKNRDYLKAALDGCAELPKQGMGKAVGVTFLCTTNYPTRVDEDLGVGKCNRYGVLPPSGQDMVDVIKFYMKNANELISDYMEEDSRLKRIDIENINLKKFAEHYTPNDKDGAFSNDALQYLVLDAADSYIERPDLDYTLHLIRHFKYAPRDITPSKYQKYMKELGKYDLDVNTSLPDKTKVSRAEYLKAIIENDEELVDFLSESELKQLEEWKKEYKELTEGTNE